MTEYQQPDGYSETDDIDLYEIYQFSEDEKKIINTIQEKFLTSSKRETLQLTYYFLTQNLTQLQTTFEKYDIPLGFEKFNFLINTSPEPCSYFYKYLISALNNCFFELFYPHDYIWDFNIAFFDYPNKTLDAYTVGIFASILSRGLKFSETETFLENYFSSIDKNSLTDSDKIVMGELINIYLNGCLIPQQKYEKSKRFVKEFFFIEDNLKTSFIYQITNIEHGIVEEEMLNNNNTTNNNTSTEKSSVSYKDNEREEKNIINLSQSNNSTGKNESTIAVIFEKITSPIFATSNFIIQKLHLTLGRNISKWLKIIFGLTLSILFIRIYRVNKDAGKKLLSFYFNQLVDFIDVAFNLKNSIRRMKRNQIVF